MNIGLLPDLNVTGMMIQETGFAAMEMRIGSLMKTARRKRDLPALMTYQLKKWK